MKLPASLINRNFAIAFIITLVAAVAILADSWIVGKDNFFLLLNADLGRQADNFFRFSTYLGDGAIWVIVAGLFFIFQKDKFPLLVSSIVVSTLLTQLIKNFLFPLLPRPTAAIANLNLIHTVSGVEVHTAFSFPSGHTATAFTIYLLACLLIKRKWIIPVGFFYALLVGYSRVYLAQHFPIDIAGGMLVSVSTVLVAIYAQKQWNRIKKTA